MAPGYPVERPAPVADRDGRTTTRIGPLTGATVDLYWLPVGAGGHCVRLNGRIFEALSAGLERRPRNDLYHSALAVRLCASAFVIEMTPIRIGDGTERGVVAEGAVGSRWARSLPIFRYEIRRWRDGFIPDVAEAVASPQRLSVDPLVATRILELLPRVPTPVWGRDELHAGEMWNSNSVTAWLISSSGLDVETVRLPANGRAPGWRAGVVVAQRQAVEARLRVARVWDRRDESAETRSANRPRLGCHSRPRARHSGYVR